MGLLLINGRYKVDALPAFSNSRFRYHPVQSNAMFAGLACTGVITNSFELVGLPFRRFSAGKQRRGQRHLLARLLTQLLRASLAFDNLRGLVGCDAQVGAGNVKAAIGVRGLGRFEAGLHRIHCHQQLVDLLQQLGLFLVILHGALLLLELDVA